MVGKIEFENWLNRRWLLVVACVSIMVGFPPIAVAQEVEVDKIDAPDKLGEIACWSIAQPSRRLLAAPQKGLYVYELDVISGERIRQFRLRKPVTDMVTSHGLSYCVHQELPMVTLIDLSTNEVVRRIMMENLKPPFRLHHVNCKKSEVILTGQTQEDETAICKLDGVAGREVDRIIFPQPLTELSLSPAGERLVATDSSAQTMAFDVSWNDHQLVLTGMLNLGKDILEQFARTRYWLVDPANPVSSNGLIKYRHLNLPDGFYIGEFTSDRTVYVAYKPESQDCDLVIADYRSGKRERIELTLENFSTTGLDFQFFGNPREKYLAVSNWNQVRIVNVTKVNSSAGFVWRSPLASTYRGLPNEPLTIGIDQEKFSGAPVRPTWKIVSAPEGTTINGQVIKIPAESTQLGQFELRLGMENSDSTKEFSTLVSIANPEIDLGFVPAAYGVSPDWKLAGFAGTYTSGKIELVLVDLAAALISQRIELEKVPEVLGIGADYIYIVNESRVTVYDRKDYSRLASNVEFGVKYPFLPTADGNVVYRKGKSIYIRSESSFVSGSSDAIKLEPLSSRLNPMVYRQSNGYVARWIAQQNGMNFLRGGGTIPELYPRDVPVANHRWNTALYGGCLFDSVSSRKDPLCELPELNGATCEQFPLAFSLQYSTSKIIEVVGVFRNLVDLEAIHKTQIYKGPRPSWFANYYSRLVQNRERKSQSIQPQVNLLSIGKQRAAFLFGSRVILFPVPDFASLTYPKPMQLNTTMIQPAKWTEPTRFELRHQNGGAIVQAKLVNPVKGVTLDDQTHEVGVDLPTVWQGVIESELAKIPTFKGSVYQEKSHSKSTTQNDLFQKLYGRNPTGRPLALTLNFEAHDAQGQAASLTRCVVLDVPDDQYDRLESTFNDAISKFRNEKFATTAKKHFGTMNDDIDKFVENSEPIQLRYKDTFASDKMDKLVERCQQSQRDASEQYDQLKDRLREFEQQKPSPTYDRFVDLAKQFDDQKEQSSKLVKHFRAIRFQTIGILSLASMFYFWALFVLSRNPPNVDNQDG